MPIPGLTDVYEFSDWLKKEYSKTKPIMYIHPENGGLITVSVAEDKQQMTKEQADEWWQNIVYSAKSDLDMAGSAGK